MASSTETFMLLGIAGIVGYLVFVDPNALTKLLPSATATTPPATTDPGVVTDPATMLPTVTDTAPYIEPAAPLPDVSAEDIPKDENDIKDLISEVYKELRKDYETDRKEEKKYKDERTKAAEASVEAQLLVHKFLSNPQVTGLRRSSPTVSTRNPVQDAARKQRLAQILTASVKLDRRGFYAQGAAPRPYKATGNPILPRYTPPKPTTTTTTQLPRGVYLPTATRPGLSTVQSRLPVAPTRQCVTLPSTGTLACFGQSDEYPIGLTVA